MSKRALASKRPRVPTASVGLTHWFEGDFHSAQAQLERAVAESDAGRDRSLAFRFGQDPGVASMLNLALALCPLSESGKARRLLDAALAQAQHGGHIPTIAYAHGQTCIVEGTYRDADRLRPHARALTTLAREHGLQPWIPVGAFFEQWAIWRERQQRVDISEMQSAMAWFRIGFQPLVPLSGILTAEVQGEQGEPDAGISLIDELLKEIERTGQRWLDAEVHRQRGQLLLRCRTSGIDAAEAAFQLALDTARGQRARMFERRAATDLARLWRESGKCHASFWLRSMARSGAGDLEDAGTLLAELA